MDSNRTSRRELLFILSSSRSRRVARDGNMYEGKNLRSMARCANMYDMSIPNDTATKRAEFFGQAVRPPRSCHDTPDASSVHDAATLAWECLRARTMYTPRLGDASEGG